MLFVGYILSQLFLTVTYIIIFSFQLIGFGLSLLEGVDPNPENFVSAGIIQTKGSQIGCLLRLEPNLQASVSGCPCIFVLKAYSFKWNVELENEIFCDYLWWCQNRLASNILCGRCRPNHTLNKSAISKHIKVALCGVWVLCKSNDIYFKTKSVNRDIPDSNECPIVDIHPQRVHLWANLFDDFSPLEGVVHVYHFILGYWHICACDNI